MDELNSIADLSSRRLPNGTQHPRPVVLLARSTIQFVFPGDAGSFVGSATAA